MQPAGIKPTGDDTVETHGTGFPSGFFHYIESLGLGSGITNAIVIEHALGEDRDG